MRWHVLAVPVAVAALVGLLPLSAYAQTRTTRGTVTDLQGNTLTVKVDDQSMAFQVDSRTIVTADGAGTAARAAAAAGRSGPKLSDLIKPGDAVEVMYQEANGTRQASKIRRTRTPGRQSEAISVELANGTVESVTGASVTINGGGGGRQTFVIDRDTKVVAPGAGTASRAREGAVTVPDLVSVGDRITVSFHRSGGALHAAEIRVR
jgi:hypothetical protein